MRSVRAQLIARQAPDALLALVQHIRDHRLGMPLNIAPPTGATPFFSLSVASFSLDAWMASPLMEVLDVEVAPSGVTGIGGQYEHVTVTARFAGLIPVQLVALRHLLAAVPNDTAGQVSA